MHSVHLIFLLIITLKLNHALKTCKETNNSVVYVSRCPVNKNEWLKAKAKKDCESLNHMCASSEKLLYHCVPTEDIHKFVEVCAQHLTLFGYCPEWNTGGSVLQPSFNRSCTNFSKPCPEAYSSNETFRYQDCYEYNSTVHIVVHTVHTEDKNSPNITVVIVALVCVVVAFGIATVIIIWYRRKRNIEQDYFTSREMEELSMEK